MTHAEAFLQAVLDAPDDDAPRLLFADWLDEHGDPDRAEFIRVQIAATAGAAPPGLWTRQHQLLTAHEAEWSAPVRRLAAEWAFRRGFIDEVRIEAGAFAARAADLFSAAPIRKVQLYREPAPDWKRSHFVPLLVLAECACVANLHTLVLSDCHVNSDGISAFLASPHLTGLAEFDLSGNQIGDRGARALADSPLLTRLVRLDLSGNGIGPAGVRALARSLELSATRGDPPRLRSLPLHGNPLGEAGRRAVLSSPLLSRAADLPAPERMSRGAFQR